MAIIHARVTVQLEVPDEELHRIVKECTDERGVVCDYDLLDKDAIKFLKDGTIDLEWDDIGYIPDNWLMYDAVESGLYDGDENGLRRKGE